MTNYDVIKKLLGSIKPAGETHIDDIRLFNLKETIEVVDKLLVDINDVAKCIGRSEYSIKKAATIANDYLIKISEQ